MTCLERIQRTGTRCKLRLVSDQKVQKPLSSVGKLPCRQCLSIIIITHTISLFVSRVSECYFVDPFSASV